MPGPPHQTQSTMDYHFRFNGGPAQPHNHTNQPEKIKTRWAVSLNARPTAPHQNQHQHEWLK